MTAQNILLVGCGNLGRAMLGQWLKNPGLNFTLIEPNPSLELLDLIEPHEARVVVNPTMPFKADIVVLAVKPQQMDDVLGSLARGLAAGTLVISVAAGKTLDFFAQALRDGHPVVRAIPNMAASAGESMTVCVANAHVSAAQRADTQALFEVIGKVLWMESDKLLSPVTAVSGSGPAYVFLLIECMAKAALAGGLAPEDAMALARQTVIGAGALLRQSKLSPEDLRKQVTSPGGTTEAALKILNGDDGLQKLMTKAIAAALEKSKQLAG